MKVAIKMLLLYITVLYFAEIDHIMRILALNWKSLCHYVDIRYNALPKNKIKIQHFKIHIFIFVFNRSIKFIARKRSMTVILNTIKTVTSLKTISLD